MSAVYLSDSNGSSLRLVPQTPEVNEARGLRDLCASNPELLCGPQISASGHSRWLLIKKEMPVTCPASGSERWSADLVFVDQDAVLTLVECKLGTNPESRREVIGQMLDYAANGTHYWNKATLRAAMEATHGDDAKHRLGNLLSSADPLEHDDFLDRVIENLRAGRVRLIFLLDKAPYELRSIAKFLNDQLSLAEVLVVEVRKYLIDGRTLYQPVLLGYSERARVQKREAPDAVARRGRWDLESFLARALEQGGPQEALRSLYAGLADKGIPMKFGSGVGSGTFMPIVRDPANPRTESSFMGVSTTGKIEIYFGYLDWHPSFSAALRDLLERRLGFDVAPGRWPKIPPETWAPKLAEFVNGLAGILGSVSVIPGEAGTTETDDARVAIEVAQFA